jgi:regulatory protein
MVVRFTPSPGDGAPEEPARRTRIPAADSAGARGERIAPVTYLPGARPSPKAAAARDSVERIRRGDAASTPPGARVDDEPGADLENGKTGSKRTAARASNVSLHQLARRGMSRWELNQVLQRREVEPSVANAELDRLESVDPRSRPSCAVVTSIRTSSRMPSPRSRMTTNASGPSSSHTSGWDS